MTWTKRWGYEMASKPTRPGIYRLKDGGFYVRARVKDPTTGGRKDVGGPERSAKTPAEAQRLLDERVAAARAEAKGEAPTKQTWRSFAISRLAERIRKGKVMSEATVDRWKDAIAIFVPEWGHLDATAVTRHHIDLWLDKTVSVWMSKGKTVARKRKNDAGELVVQVTTKIKPTTVNGWLRVLRAISHAIKVKFDLVKSAFDGIEFFEEGRLYSREEPNAIPPELLPRFMAIAKAKFPQHFGMIALGMVTGLRPSSLRPLRRKGREADLDWDTGVLQIRRSHSRRQLVMPKTKTGRDNEITLPPSVLEILREHVAALPDGAMSDSDLLFPGDTGKLRTRNVLAKPFAAIAAEMGLPFRLTPRGMRRTFNDLARAVGIHDVITRSISGHQTETMQRHYSTASDEEQRTALTRVHAAIEGKEKKV